MGHAAGPYGPGTDWYVGQSRVWNQIIFQERTCGCGGSTQVAVCTQLGQGNVCDQLTGPLISCGSCFLGAAGDCLNAREFGLRSPVLKTVAQSLSNCGPATQISFADWLRIKLEARAHRS